MSRTDFSRSLQELENSDWGDPDPADTLMVQRCYALRRKPLNELTNGEVRLAVGQGIGFPFTLDLAFERLESNPLAEGDYYPGDILANLIRAPAEVWVQRPELRAKLTEYFELAMQQPAEVTESFREVLDLPPTGGSIN